MHWRNYLVTSFGNGHQPFLGARHISGDILGFVDMAGPLRIAFEEELERNCSDAFCRNEK
jgi:hypothetical protein